MATNCNLLISDLRTPGRCERVTSGVRRLIYVPKDDVDAINAVVTSSPQEFEEYVEIGSTAMTQKLLTLKSGCECAEIYASKNLGELKYTTQGGNRGNRSLHVSIEVHHPGFRKKMLAFLGIAANMEFVLMVQLANGQWHLIGDMDRGAQLSDGAEATSGKASTDQNGATMTFEWDTVIPRVMFDEWRPEDETYGVEMYRIAYLLADEDYVVLGDEDYVPLEIPVL